MHVDAQRRWSEALDAWAIPDDILARAPQSPWGFPPSLFQAHREVGDVDTPSVRRALEALPEGGAVLDVGVGAGAGSLPLAPPAAVIVGVDQSEDMLDAFARAADAAGVDHRAVRGRWPDVAGEAGRADVAVCHHVFYNAPDLAPFADALTKAARRRVVVEMTAIHPASTLNDLWMHFHGLERPSGPTFADAVAVLEDLGLEADVERWSRPARRQHTARADVVAFVRRRLCLPADKDAEIDALLGPSPTWTPTEVVTLSWEGAAPSG